MRFSRLFPVFLASTALGLLAGCDYADRVPVQVPAPVRAGATDLSGSSEFDRELIAAKSGNPDGPSRERAILAILEKYRIPHASGTSAAVPPSARTVPPAGKTAASSFNPVRRDMIAGNDIHTYYGTVTVNGLGGSLGVGVIGEADNVDPVLVAFHREDGPTLVEAYPVKVVGFNDDISGSNRNSALTWINTGFKARTVEIVAFAFQHSARGKATIKITANGVTKTLASREMGGLRRFGATALPPVPGNCFPSRTTIKETPLKGGGFKAAALVVDVPAKKGGLIWDTPSLGPLSLTFSPVFNTDGPSFALLFEAYGSVLPPNWSETPSEYRLTHTDNYTCVQ